MIYVWSFPFVRWLCTAWCGEYRHKDKVGIKGRGTMQIEKINGNRYVDMETGLIMSIGTALKSYRSVWNRQAYKDRRVFGGGSTDNTEAENEALERLKEESSGLDATIWQWENEKGETVISSWKENRARVARQIMGMRHRRSKERLSLALPDTLTQPERWLCGIILTKEYIKLTTGLVRCGNGYPMDTKAIAKLTDLSPRTARRILRGLINKGVLIRKKNSYFVNKQLYTV